MSQLIPTAIVPSVELAEIRPRQVEREFRALSSGGDRVRCMGECASDPMQLLSLGYTPKHKVELFGTRFYFSNPRQNPAVRFIVGYVVQHGVIHPRIFYKDLSLVWRVASHLISEEDEFWIGKGDVRTIVERGEEAIESVESTTDLPYEIQPAIETVNRSVRKVREDEDALYLVLRRAPAGRIRPYNDFAGPRRKAADNRRNLIYGNRSIARFTRKNDPTSLRVVPGFEPDFSKGVIDVTDSRSAMYGGALQRFRIASRNRRIQYMFMAGPHHAWIIPPQTVTTDLSTFGVRTVDVVADEDLFVPGYEYHYFDPDVDVSEHFSQIPKGFAGAASTHDPDRADASAWLEQIPLIREFRRKVLGRR